MNFPVELKYTQGHEWVKILDDKTAKVGISDFAQSELGDIVFVEIETVGSKMAKDEIFGTVEAVKTVSDLFLPVAGTVLEVNELLGDQPELINNDPYGEGWLIKMEVADLASLGTLLDVAAYKSLIGK